MIDQPADPRKPSIIKATTDDVPTIKSMTDAAYTKYIERIGKPPAPMTANYYEVINTHDVYLLQNSSGHTAGAIVLKHDSGPRITMIDNLVVDPSAQGRGYGRFLIEYAEDVARSRGCDTLELYTNVKMVENLRLYVKMGFDEVGRKVEDGFERVYFRRILK